ncbi:MAG: hypothetical protein E7313_00590 [Clostridiales bacterium]|nr:hypothetical protein [Clostridiales bacterium]
MGIKTKTGNKLHVIEALKKVFANNEENTINVLDEIPDWKDIIKHKNYFSEEELNTIQEINNIESEVKQRRISVSHNKNRNANTMDTLEDKKKREQIKVIKNEEKITDKIK